ncbi:MAG: glyoxalase [Chloroflexi bacterium]|nr:glyoxalase [Chloroflexota bacterium]
MADSHNVPGTTPEVRLELVPIPVSEVDRAKAFYEQAGFALLVDVQPVEGMRVVQFTPPGSACSIVFGTGMQEISDMRPGTIKGLHLVVADMDTARSALIQRGLDVGEITDLGGVKYAGFSDPDGNLWMLQEFPPETRQPGQSFYAEPEDSNR